MTSLFFKQFIDPETSTYTYVVADFKTKEAAIVDSVKKHADIYIQFFKSNGLNLKYLLETHVHADHVTANSDLRKAFPNAEIAIHEKASIGCPHISLTEGHKLQVGNIEIEVLYTPGHTSESCVFKVNHDRILTGDTMLIESCGRTDFQAGNSRSMFESLQRLSKLPAETLVYPGHDYNGRWVSSIQEQLGRNKLLKMTFEEFRTELDGWNLPPPKNIHFAVPGNQNCGEDK